jgi:hypothetical protein
MVSLNIISKKMSNKQLKAKAKNLGINPENMNKTELIHTIQRAEGFTPCFGTSNGYCPQEACCFRADCLT